MRDASEGPGGLLVLGGRATPLTLRLMPAWAVVCGALASDALGGSRQTWVQLILTLVLVDAGWGTLWAGIGGTDWASPVKRWREWPVGGSIPVLPFTRSGSVGDRLSRGLGRLRAWWRQDLWPNCGDALVSIAVGLLAVVLFSVLLGNAASLLSVAALATIQLGAVLSRGSGSPRSSIDAVVVLTLPWLVGYSGFSQLAPAAVMLPVLLAVAYGAARACDRGWVRTLGLGAMTAIGSLLLFAGQPIAAIAACLLLLPPLLLAPWVGLGYPRPRVGAYARPWLMAVMLTAALAA